MFNRDRKPQASTLPQQIALAQRDGAKSLRIETDDEVLEYTRKPATEAKEK